MHRLALGGLLMLLACGGEPFTPAPPEPFVLDLPAGVPAPRVPADNPLTEAKVALGRRLFYDARLSGNGTQACASCHDPARAFTEARPVSVGSTGEVHPRNAQSLANVAYAPTLTWANPVLHRLELQNFIPLFSEEPVEMGALGREEEILARLRDEVFYPPAFEEAFPGDPDPVRFENVVLALASFQRTLLSFDSPYDRYTRGEDPAALSAAALRGMELFFSERLECFHCHGGFLFSESVAHEGSALPEQPFFNTGLYNLDGLGAYPRSNPGVLEITGRPEDMGRFRAPSLRNVAVTAPYAHDGTVASLEAMIDIYARGGRLIEEGPWAGDGAESPLKSGFVRGFFLSGAEKADLLAFLESLTDPGFLFDPRHANPWEDRAP